MIKIGERNKVIISAAIVAVSLFALKPSLAYLLYRRGGDYMSAGIVPDAARTYAKAVAFNYKDVDSRNWLAYCYSVMGRTGEAIAEYKRAIEIDPEDVVAFFDLGMIYRKDGDMKTAREYFVKAAACKQSPNVTDQNYKFYTKSARTMLDILSRP